MKCTRFSIRSSSHALRVLLAAAALTAIACDSHVTISPVVPEMPPGPGMRTLQISGSLTPEDGACVEATVLYDGVELAGARVTCSQPTGCAKLELAATVRTTSGRHTIGFQLLQQSKKAIRYVAEGSVLMSRDGIPLGGVLIDLGPTRARLRSGEAVSFEVEFRD